MVTCVARETQPAAYLQPGPVPRSSQHGSSTYYGYTYYGSTYQGLFHEALNMAAIWRLPVLFVCENNQVPLVMSPLSAAGIVR